MADARPSRLPLMAAFAAVYLIWGSTYLAIRFAIETMPPFVMASVRFLIAGTLLYVFARWRGAPRPSALHWRSAAVIGGLLLLGGNGGVVWAEQRIASGLTALIVASVPFWVVLLEWLRPGGTRPGARLLFGVGLGLAGIVLLVGPGEIAGGGGVDLLGTAVLLVGNLCWTIGSLYSRHAPLPASPLLTTAMEMLSGGVLLGLAATASGEWGRFHPAAISGRSLAAFAYLIVFGALVAYSAFIWLLRVASPPMVATYAYVNPVVAVFLGWALAGEPITARTLIAAAVIVAAVMAITTYRARAVAGIEPEVEPAGASSPPAIGVMEEPAPAVTGSCAGG